MKLETIGEQSTVPDDSGSRLKRATEQWKARRRFGDAVYEEIMKLRPSDYLAHPIAKGGEHLVFTVPNRVLSGFRDVVVKVNFDQTVAQLPTLLKQDEYARDDAQNELHHSAVVRQEQLKELRRYFGFAAIPVEQTMVRDIPVTPRVVHEFAPWTVHSTVPIPRTIPALLTVQRRLELHDGKGQQYVSLNGGYPEASLSNKRMSEEAAQIYDTAHDILVGRSVEKDPERRTKAICSMYPELRSVAERIKHDPSFAEKLRDVVDRLLQYSRETNIALDLVGRDNLLLLKKEEEWVLKMPDALPLGKQKFEYLKKVYDELHRRAHAGEALELSSTETGLAFNPLNTLRVINALAILSGSPRRLWMRGLKEIPPSVWREGIRSYFVSKLESAA